MRLYLAASYSRKKEIKAIAKRFRKAGFKITSDWFNRTDGLHLKEEAESDIAGVRLCDALVRFTDKADESYVPIELISGGRMFETGFACAIGKIIVTVGGKQNVFDDLPYIIHAENVSHAIKILRRKRDGINAKIRNGSNARCR
jgi:nucleoside 2-deoxyribosyltransferase